VSSSKQGSMWVIFYFRLSRSRCVLSAILEMTNNFLKKLFRSENQCVSSSKQGSGWVIFYFRLSRSRCVLSAIFELPNNLLKVI
jgi:hypothetical protein